MNKGDEIYNNGKEIYDREYVLWKADFAADLTTDTFRMWLSRTDPSGTSLQYYDHMNKAADGPIEPAKQPWPNRTAPDMGGPVTARIDTEKAIELGWPIKSFEEWMSYTQDSRERMATLYFGKQVQVDRSTPTIYAHSDWDKLVNNMFEEVRHLAKAKGGEYSGDTDRLANFRRNGLDQDLPMESIWRVYAAKHWDAIGQYVKDLRSGKQRERMEPIDGRIKDLIVYLLLFQAMVDERAKD